MKICCFSILINIYRFSHVIELNQYLSPSLQYVLSVQAPSIPNKAIGLVIQVLGKHIKQWYLLVLITKKRCTSSECLPPWAVYLKSYFTSFPVDWSISLCISLTWSTRFAHTTTLKLLLTIVFFNMYSYIFCLPYFYMYCSYSCNA